MCNLTFSEMDIVAAKLAADLFGMTLTMAGDESNPTGMEFRKGEGGAYDKEGITLEHWVAFDCFFTGFVERVTENAVRCVVRNVDDDPPCTFTYGCIWRISNRPCEKGL